MLFASSPSGWLPEAFRSLLDQLFQEENPGGPDDGWAKWSTDGASKAGCVLIISSAGWCDAWDMNNSPGLGLGAAAEAAVIREQIYEETGALSSHHQPGAERIGSRERRLAKRAGRVLVEDRGCSKRTGRSGSVHPRI